MRRVVKQGKRCRGCRVPVFAIIGNNIGVSLHDGGFACPYKFIFRRHKIHIFI
jgi:hypothetical protein